VDSASTAWPAEKQQRVFANTRCRRGDTSRSTMSFIWPKAIDTNIQATPSNRQSPPFHRKLSQTNCASSSFSISLSLSLGQLIEFCASSSHPAVSVVCWLICYRPGKGGDGARLHAETTTSCKRSLVCRPLCCSLQA